MLRLSLQRFIGMTAQNIGNWFNNEKLVIWGITHTPFTFEVEDDAWDQA
jgi:hypothetical protein